VRKFKTMLGSIWAWDGQQGMWLVNRAGAKDVPSGYPIEQAEEFVRAGIWTELWDELAVEEGL
jgi:hypothetical protein